MEKIIKLYNVETKEVDKDKYTLEAIFSSADEDRHGDVVLQNWELKRFKKNPVILNSHTYGDATEVIGKAENISVVDGKLEGKIKFAVNENPKAKVIFDLYAGGFLNAFSVGFIALEFNKEKQISKSELLEVSAVSVPANAIALAKSKGINVELLNNKEEYENNEIGSEETESSEPVIEPDGGEGGGTVENEGNSDTGEVEISGEDTSAVLEEETEQEQNDSEGVGTGTGITVEEKKQLVLNKIAKAVKILGELNTKVRTPHKNGVRAKNYALINKAIRNLINEKKKI